MTHRFGTRRRIWITEVLLPILFSLGFVVSLAVWGNLTRHHLYWLLGLCATTMAIVLYRDALPRWRNHLVVDSSTIAGHIDRLQFAFAWSEILAIEHRGTEHDQHISISTAHQQIIIPVYEFDAPQIWQRIAMYASPESLSADAYKRIPGYAEWAIVAARLTHDEQTTLRATMRWYTWMGGGTAVLFLGVSVLVWWLGQGFVALFFLLVSVLGVFILLRDGLVEFDSGGLSYRSLFGRYRIEWEEIRRIEFDPLGQTLVLIGDTKQVALPGPPAWTGADKARMIEMLGAQVDQRQIQIEQTEKALSKGSKNAKVH